MQVRPAKEAKEAFATLSPSEVWGASKWSRALAAKVLDEHISPHPAGTTYRLSERDKALSWMVKQYGHHLVGLASDLGGWECGGSRSQRSSKIRQREDEPVRLRGVHPSAWWPIGGGSQGFAVRLVALLVARVCGFSGSCPAGGLSASVLCEVFASAACLSWAFRLATSRRWAFSECCHLCPKFCVLCQKGGVLLCKHSGHFFASCFQCGLSFCVR